MDRIDESRGVNILASFNLREGQITAKWTSSNRKIVPEVELAIEEAWKKAASRPGVYLFDGPMCRLERWEHFIGQLSLELSPLTYRIFMGTNLSNPRFAAKYGDQVLANALGVSPALESADGFLLLGRRNSRVAYYPSRVHPFAGSVDPPAEGQTQTDVFAEVRRELREELGMTKQDLAGEPACIGIAQDRTILQPELIFAVRSKLTRTQIESRLDAKEHAGIVAIAGDQQGLKQVFADWELTPIAVGSLLLWASYRLGVKMFEERRVV